MKYKNYKQDWLELSRLSDQPLEFWKKYLAYLRDSGIISSARCILEKAVIQTIKELEK